MNAASKGVRGTQRDRLIAGVITVAAKRGYAHTTVSEIVSRAGVSRPTFYEYFADRDECFLVAQREASQRLVDHVRRVVAQEAPERAIQAGVRALIEHAKVNKDAARFLAHETLAGGFAALDERDKTIERVAEIVDKARSRTSPQTPAPDLPARPLLGGVQRLYTAKLRRGPYDLSAFANDLICWVETYTRPASEHHWRTLKPRTAPAPSPYRSELLPHPPQRLPRGRSRLSPEEIARNHRERLLYATAELATRKGYASTTIGDITSVAGVDRRIFYSHFQDKQHAFLAVCELDAQQTLALAARAYFDAASWPERVWEATRAAVHFQGSFSVISHVGFVESHAIGPPAVQSIDDARSAFAIFLQEGARNAAVQVPDAGLEAVTTAVWEIGYAQARAGRGARIPRFAQYAVYLSIAPFLGPQAADDLIHTKLIEEDALTRAAGA